MVMSEGIRTYVNLRKGG